MYLQLNCDEVIEHGIGYLFKLLYWFKYLIRLVLCDVGMVNCML